jgi:hypothetical protein
MIIKELINWIRDKYLINIFNEFLFNIINTSFNIINIY